MGTIERMLKSFAKKQMKASIKALTPKPRPIECPAFAIVSARPSEKYGYISINEHGKDTFDGEIIAQGNGIFLAQGHYNNREALLLFTTTGILSKKYIEEDIEHSIINPDGTAIALGEFEYIYILTDGKTSTRLFEYGDSDDDQHVATDRVFARITDEWGEGIVPLKCFNVETQSTWTKKIKYKFDDEDESTWIEQRPTLTIDNDVFEIIMPDKSTRHYSIDGKKL